MWCLIYRFVANGLCWVVCCLLFAGFVGCLRNWLLCVFVGVVVLSVLFGLS